jgi:hypothetical protein
MRMLLFHLFRGSFIHRFTRRHRKTILIQRYRGNLLNMRQYVWRSGEIRPDNRDSTYITTSQVEFRQPEKMEIIIKAKQ